MRNEILKTKVAFRKFPEGDVIALFPEMQGADFISKGKRHTYIGTYQSIGQHSDAHPSLITDLKPASKGEYKDLYDELINIGYELSIVP